MPEQMAFARKASGLVRGLSFVDAFGVGFYSDSLTGDPIPYPIRDEILHNLVKTIDAAECEP